MNWETVSMVLRFIYSKRESIRTYLLIIFFIALAAINIKVKQKEYESAEDRNAVSRRVPIEIQEKCRYIDKTFQICDVKEI